MRVVDVMTADVVAAQPEWSLRQSVHVMVDAGGSGLPVIGGGAVVGIITEADFIETEAGRTIGRQRLFDTVFGGKRTTIPSTVGAAMTRSPVVAIG